MTNITHFFNIGEDKYALDYRNNFFCLLDEDTEKGLKLAVSGEPTPNANAVKFNFRPRVKE